MESDGDPTAPILVVGMAPGSEELEVGRPFVGRSGRFLWKNLQEVGIDRSMCRVVNVCCGWPEGKDGDPTPAQIVACSARFDREMAESQAIVALALGGVAMRRLTGITQGIQTIAGYLVRPDERLPRLVKTRGAVGEYQGNRKCVACAGEACKVCGGTGWAHKKGDPKMGPIVTSALPILPPYLRWIIPNYHPAGVQRAGYTPAGVFAAACDRAARALRGEVAPVNIEKWEAVPYGIELPSGGMVALDIETPMDSPIVERIGLSFDSGQTYTALWNSESAEFTRKVLADPRTTKVAHNISFDLPRLEGAGCEVRGPLFCTMQAAHLLQPDMRFGLGATVPYHLDALRWKHMGQDRPDYYNANDAAITLKLAHAQDAEMHSLGMDRLFHDILMVAYRPLIAMTDYGIYTDAKRIAEWSLQLGSEMAGLRARWQQAVGNVNYNAPQQVNRLFYRAMKMWVEYGKYGQVTVEDDAVQELIYKYPEHKEVLSLYRELRGKGKLISTYASIEAAGDGCLHPSYLPRGRYKDEDEDGRKGLPATLRLASSPNIQNQPEIARRIFIPHQTGQVILAADYSQIEMRISAHLSGDTDMIRDLATDLHQGTVARLAALGIDIPRKLAKVINYCLSYGGGAKRVAKTVRSEGFPMNEVEAQKVIDAIFRAYPGWFRWRQEIGDFVAAHSYVRNPFGFRRALYGGRRDITKALDTIPQSTAAVILWDRILPLYDLAKGFGGALLTTVHDEFVFEFPKDVLPQAAEAVRESMMKEYPEIAPGFRVPVDIEVGPNWGELAAWPF